MLDIIAGLFVPAGGKSSEPLPSKEEAQKQEDRKVKLQIWIFSVALSVAVITDIFF
jgi:hypothetical protein